MTKVHQAAATPAEAAATIESAIVHGAAEVIQRQTAEAIAAGLARFGIDGAVQADARLTYVAVNLAAANFEATKHAADLAAARDHLAVLETIVTQRRALADSILASADSDPVDRRRAIVLVTECMAAESFVKSSRGTLQRLDTGAEANAVARCADALRTVANEIILEALATHDQAKRVRAVPPVCDQTTPVRLH